MKQTQIVKYIMCSCMLLVGVISAVILYKNFRPSSISVPYEELSPEEALEFMEFEEGYILVDLRDADEFAQEHMEHAVNIPYEELVDRHAEILPEKGQMIYLYSGDDETGRKAAMKLCGLDYTSVACIIASMSETEKE